MQQVIQIANITPDQLSDMVRQAVRSELTTQQTDKSPDKQLPDYLTRKETANLLRISLVTLHKLTNEGTLQSLEINGQIRYRRNEILSALKEVKNGRTKR